MSGSSGYVPGDHEAMMSVIGGHFVSQVARTLAELRVPDLLHTGPQTAEAIAESAGSSPDATLRLMRCAVFAGFAAHDDGRFATTGLLDRLRGDAPDSLRSLAIVWNSPGHWRQWGQFPEAVRTGTEQSAAAHGKPIWAYFSENPAEGDLFAQAMSELSTPIIREAVTKISAEPGDTIVDIGGSTGAFVLSMLEQHPGTSGIVNDLPHVMDAAHQEIDRRDMTDRCTTEPSDFFNGVPAANLYLLKFILHDWDDDACVALLEQCRMAMKASARIEVVEMVLGPPSAPGSAALMDLNMLALAPGRERDLADFDRLFTAAGLRRTRNTALTEPYYVIEAVAA